LISRGMPRRATPAEVAADGLHSAAIHLLRSLRREDARLGVGPAGLSVLSVLVFGGPKTMSELAALEQVRKPTMSRIVTSLERWDMVERLGADDDRRSILVHATATGRVVMRRGRANRLDELARRLERGFTQEEIALLARAAALIDRLARSGELRTSRSSAG
ncbi:MAG: MarR family winged helix-turn-helix transcriptional regulator, partial [Gemmatimonadales bacterium]